MAANSSIILTQLDFDTHKNSLKSYLKEQAAFKDYDFESSNINVLLDILSYNTYLNTFYLNMVGNEMFLDSAQLRDSVVSHAKELNYLPRSFTSSRANIDITINSSDPAKRLVVIPKGTGFISRVGSETFTFSTIENIVVSSANSTFIASNVPIYEGTYLSETYPISYDLPLVYKLNNRTADIGSIAVTIIEDNGSTTLEYSRATSLFGLDETSQVFFVQPAIGDTYEITFGDGVVGRKPKNNSIVVIEYRSCRGELPNGATKFINSGRIDNEANVSIVTVSNASGGAVAETLESIKNNAPRAFTAQERAITTEDYENLLKLNFPEINAVSAYGGEELSPPQYGRVFVAIDLKDVDGLPNIKRDEYYRFLRARSSVGITPVFANVDYTYLRIDSTIKYNVNRTLLNQEDIRTLVTSKILEYSKTNLDSFNRTLRYSRFVKDIDDSDKSIVSNETEIKLVKYLKPDLNTNINLTLDFKVPIEVFITNYGAHPTLDRHSVETSVFRYNGLSVYIEDDGLGVMRMVTTRDSGHDTVLEVGTVNYDTGVIKLNNFKIQSYEGSDLKIFVNPRNKDITSTQNTILNILEPDINLTIEQIRE